MGEGGGCAVMGTAPSRSGFHFCGMTQRSVNVAMVQNWFREHFQFYWRKTVYNAENCSLRLVPTSLWWEEGSWHWALPITFSPCSLLVMPADRSFTPLWELLIRTTGTREVLKTLLAALHLYFRSNTVTKTTRHALMAQHSGEATGWGWPQQGDHQRPPALRDPRTPTVSWVPAPRTFFCPSSFPITVVFIQDAVSRRGCWDATSLVLQTARCGNITWWSEGEGPGLPSGDSETLRQLWAAKRDLCLLRRRHLNASLKFQWIFGCCFFALLHIFHVYFMNFIRISGRFSPVWSEIFHAWFYVVVWKLKNEDHGFMFKNCIF